MNINSLKVRGYGRCVEMNMLLRRFRLFSEEDTNHNLNFDQCLVEFKNPSHITNAILTINSDEGLERLDKSLFFLEKLLCKYVVLEVNYKITLTQLQNILDTVNKYNIHELTFLGVYSEEMYSEELIDVSLTSNRYKVLVFYDSVFDKNLENVILYFKRSKQITFEKTIHEFSPDKDLIIEAQQHHTYFNRKLYIGGHGEIKNAPECTEEFGYIQNISHVDDLKTIIDRPEFQKLWYVNKDKCDVCKNCEFRYMCVDNRIPYQRTEGEWYHKEPCNYNPFICKWKHEEEYLSLEDCGVTSTASEYTIDEEKISGINTALWQ